MRLLFNLKKSLLLILAIIALQDAFAQNENIRLNQRGF